MYLRTAFSIICFSAAPAQAEDVGTNGKYFTYNGTKFMTRGAEEVSSPGQFGKATGKGLLGFFYPNGFGHFGYTTSGGATRGTEFSVNGSIVATGNAEVQLAAGDPLNVGVDADASIDRTKDYRGVFVRVDDWGKVIKELNDFAETQPSGSLVFKKDFRVIDSVLYVTGYTIDSNVTLTGEISLDLDAGDNLTVTGIITGEGEKSDILVLSDGSSIAYSMRHVCWRNGEIVDIIPDVLGKARPNSCAPHK